jgi:hypothetical protein
MFSPSPSLSLPVSQKKWKSSSGISQVGITKPANKTIPARNLHSFLLLPKEPYIWVTQNVREQGKISQFLSQVSGKR